MQLIERKPSTALKHLWPVIPSADWVTTSTMESRRNLPVLTIRKGMPYLDEVPLKGVTHYEIEQDLHDATRLRIEMLVMIADHPEPPAPETSDPDSDWGEALARAGVKKP